MTSRLHRMLPLALLASTIAIVLVDSGVREMRASSPLQVRASYDPEAYYQIINQEIVQHLRFCPYFGDRQVLRGHDLIDATDAQFELLPESDAESDAARTTHDEECGKCDAQERRLNGLFCLTAASAGDPVLRARITNFAALSPLGTDLSILDRWSLGAEDRVAGIRKGVHRQRLPSTESEHVFEYRGDISFRSPALRKILIDAAGNERVLGEGSDTAQLRQWRTEQQQTLEDGRLLRSEHALPLDWGAAKLYELPGVEDRLALLVKEAGGLRVLIDGAPIKRNIRSVLAFDRGQVLEFDLPGGPPLRLRLAGERTGTISSLQVSTHGPRREIDSEAGLDDLVGGLVSGIEVSLRVLNDTLEQRGGLARDDPRFDPRRLADASITLTLDRAIHMQSVDSVRRFATSDRSPLNDPALGLRNDDGLWKEDGALVPFPTITLTVMDADSGELLGLGSYPNASTVLEALDASADITGARGRLLRELLGEELSRTSPHLQPHPIGSIFKPLFAWAVGQADPALLDFTIEGGESRGDWAYGRLDANRELTRCMVSGRRTKKQSHFSTAYGKKSTSWTCSPGTKGEDVCAALAVSDTYYFLELAVRLSLQARGLELPPPGLSERERDPAYQLWRMCGPNRVDAPDGTSEKTCVPPEQERVDVREIAMFLPDTCPDSNYTNMCSVIDALGVQLQPTNKLNDPPWQTIESYLGPLGALVEDLAADAPTQCASGKEALLDAFRWAIPASPQWDQDLMVNCAPGLESFLEGGGLNYWNDVFVVQTFGRLFVDQPDLRARLIASIEERASEDDLPAIEPITRFGRVVEAECEGSTSARCRVLLGLEGAMRRGGTLKELEPLERELAIPGKAISVRVRGKTGTLRAPYPSFLFDKQLGWHRGTTARKSLHTALLVEVADERGRARHYVVYLAIQGVDDELLSSDAAKFFLSSGPGFGVLQRVVDDAALDLGGAP